MRTVPYSIDIVKSECFEHNWERYYKLKLDDIFVEVGAFWGRYAMIAGKRKCSKVILIEPSPDNVLTLRNLVEKENLKNIIIIEKAIGNKKGITNFDISGNPAGHCVKSGNVFVDNERQDIIKRNKTISEHVEVYVDTLDNILTELNIDHVNLLSSDCEGEELHMLEGAEKYLNEKRIKNVAIGAYHNDVIKEDCIKILKSKGFRNITYEEGVLYGNI